MPRLFVALPLPEAIVERLGALAGGVPGAHWQPAGNMHLTLRFIGEVDGVMASDIALGLDTVDGAPLDLALDGVDVFGRRHGPRLLFARVAPQQPLKHLRDRIETLLRQHGLPGEGRDYRPHITLARLKGASPDRVGRFLEANGLLASRPFRLDRFALYESLLGKEGALHRELQDYRLRG